MTIRLTNARHPDRPPTFTCVRDDGSTTGMASTAFFIRHDLTHYAVETLLGVRQAFYGLVAAGWDLDSFAERVPDSRKVRLPPAEALQIERIVGAFDLDAASLEMNSEADVLWSIEQSFSAIDETIPPCVTLPFIRAVRKRRAELLAQWSALAPGDSLELPFP